VSLRTGYQLAAMSPFEVIFAFMYKTNSEKTKEALLESPPKTRQLIEELAAAYAAAVPAPEDMQMITCPTNQSCAPVSQDLIPALAQKISAIQDLEHKSKLVRLLVFSLACDAGVTSLSWGEVSESFDYSAHARLKTVIVNASRKLSFTKFSDNYIELRLRHVLPAWSVCTVPKGRRPDTMISEILNETANDVVRPMIETSIHSVFDDSAVWKTFSVECFASAVTTIQELCEGVPRVHVNEQMLVPDPDPCIVMTTDCDYGAGHRAVGIKTGTSVTYCPSWKTPVLNIIYEWLELADEEGVPEVAELANLVFRNDLSSRMAAFLVSGTHP